MSQKDLIDKIALYGSVRKAFHSKNDPDIVQIYVEGYEDVAFWRTVFGRYEAESNIRFKIQPASRAGKIEVLSLHEKVGQYLLLCVDSDFDYLLQSRTENSRKVNQNPYIFQTYTYSIENFQCYAENLHQLCVQATNNDTRLLDLVSVMEKYSAIVYDVLLWVIYFQSTDKAYEYSLAMFCDAAKILSTPDVSDKCEFVLNEVRQRMDTELARLQERFSSEKQAVVRLGDVAARLGLSRQTAYLFVQGHLIKEDVVIKILKEYCNTLANLAREAIRNSDNSDKSKNDQMSAYEKRKLKIQEVIGLNTDYQICFLYRNIIRDVENYLSSFHAGT